MLQMISNVPFRKTKMNIWFPILQPAKQYEKSILNDFDLHYNVK